MDIRVEWFDGDKWVFDCSFKSLTQAVLYACEESQLTPFGSHRVTIDGKLYVTFQPRGDSE